MSTCRTCKGKLQTKHSKGRKSCYCCVACKQKAYRERQKRNAQQQQKPLRNPLKNLNHKSIEWYTPKEYISAIRNVLGKIELDPASSLLANQTVQAERYFDKEVNGLLQEWKAITVFLNPPHNRMNTTAPWVNKLLAEYRAGNIAEAIVLVDAATETHWFSALYGFPICFVQGRISFQNGEDKPAKRPINGSAFIYLGDQHDKFCAVFRQFGKVLFLSQL